MNYSINKIGRALTLLSLLFGGVPAFSQGCALCYTQAASAGARMIEALRSGILILALPPTIASIAMLFILHHKRNQTRRTGDGVGRNESKLDW
jgi:ABC-type sulfate transport system permease component